jgi:hypothetical protein
MGPEGALLVGSIEEVAAKFLATRMRGGISRLTFQMDTAGTARKIDAGH